MRLNRIGNGWKRLSFGWSEDISKAADCLGGLASRKYDPDLEALGAEVRDDVTHDLVSGELEEVAPRGVDEHNGRLRIPGCQGCVQVPAEVLGIGKAAVPTAAMGLQAPAPSLTAVCDMTCRPRRTTGKPAIAAHAMACGITTAPWSDWRSARRHDNR
jgi:hypothetical protein